MSSNTLVASAEELLKTRSIPDLRELVQTLETDAVSKVSELQSMVGSKYHDFIQSADAIAAMQQKSEYLEGNLKKFLVLSQEVSGNTHELLEHTSIDQTNMTDTSKIHYMRGISHKGERWDKCVMHLIFLDFYISHRCTDNPPLQAWSRPSTRPPCGTIWRTAMYTAQPQSWCRHKCF